MYNFGLGFFGENRKKIVSTLAHSFTVLLKIDIPKIQGLRPRSGHGLKEVLRQFLKSMFQKHKCLSNIRILFENILESEIGGYFSLHF